LRVEQHQRRDHGRQPARGVVRHLGDQLGGQRVSDQRRLDEKQAAGRGQVHYGAHRLHHATGRKIDQRFFDGRQQGIEREMSAHGVVVEQQERADHGGDESSMGCAILPRRGRMH